MKYQLHITCKDLLESLDGVFEGHQLALRPCEHLSHLEGLAQEALHLASAGHSQLVILRQFVHTQDSDDVLKGLVVLSHGATNTVSIIDRISLIIFSPD